MNYRIHLWCRRCRDWIGHVDETAVNLHGIATAVAHAVLEHERERERDHASETGETSEP